MSDNTHIEEAEIVGDEKFLSDDAIDNVMGQDANTASATSEPEPGAYTPPAGEAKQPSATLGPEIKFEPTSDPDLGDIDDVDDLATVVVELLEKVRTEIGAPLYRRTELMKVNPIILNKTMAKMRSNEYQKGKGIYLEFTDEEEQAINVLNDIHLFEMRAPYDVVDENGRVIEKRKEKYTLRWKRFFHSIGWAKQIPPGVQLLLSVITIEGFFFYKPVKNWIDEKRNGRRRYAAPASETKEETKE